MLQRASKFANNFCMLFSELDRVAYDMLLGKGGVCRASVCKVVKGLPKGIHQLSVAEIYDRLFYESVHKVQELPISPRCVPELGSQAA